MTKSQLSIFLVFQVLTANHALSEDNASTLSKTMQNCLMQQIAKVDENTTVKALKLWCEKQLNQQNQALASKQTPKAAIKTDVISPILMRINNERAARDNPAVITPHKRNYLLPFSYVDNPNSAPFATTNNQTDSEFNLDNFEVKFQLSFKAPITESLITNEDALFFGFTLQSYWQMYNSDLSSPFRETNYQPEIFYGLVNDFKVGNWVNRVNLFGIEHQSNGRSQPLSRSWNRVYIQSVWENKNQVFMIKPWYRLPEKEKTDPLQADGDDNPDIEDFMGFFEASYTYKWDEQTFSMMLRNNLRTSNNRGAIQLDWTFPMGKRFKGYTQVFHGYGESLIDYNFKTTRIGVGVLLSDIF